MRGTVASPGRQQYLEMKSRHQDAILMFRMGDFYEMFDADAETAAKLLGIQLTARNYQRGEGRVPMAGVPHHSVHSYIRRLLDGGHRVAVCEQMSPPGKGIVEREVVRVFTPGTLVEPDMLRPEENNYLAAVAAGRDGFGLAHVDVSTGEFRACAVATPDALEVELLRVSPVECIVAPDVEATGVIIAHSVPARSVLDLKRATRILTDHLHATTLSSYGLDELAEAAIACAQIVEYLGHTNRPVLDLVDSIRVYSPDRFMVIDRYTRASLELMPRPGDGGTRWTLLRVLDRTKTGMGARRLRALVSQPLLERAPIEERLDGVQTFVDQPMLTKRLESELGAVGDIERISARVVQGRASVSDLNHLRASLEAAGAVGETLSRSGPTAGLTLGIDACPELCGALASALDGEGGVTIKAGYNAELDRFRSLVGDSRAAIAALERKEVEATGIKGLRVGYNKVFGYYFEVGKAAAVNMPERFARHQTLVNAERFLTAELKELEASIASAEDDAQTMERQLFEEIVGRVRACHGRIAATAEAVAVVDVYRSLGAVALAQGYCRPMVDDSANLVITAGRHPVVEVADPAMAFVPNDCMLDDEHRIVVLTGPNMGGKSTMLRTVALIVLMAQIGSFVPAESATVGLVDRVFSRVGAQDDIASGQSTFMTEMIETANILHNATSRSLLILDEIGRGTSTYDGLAIARAVVEFIHARIGARTLFATHYHELASLQQELTQVVNFHTEIAEHEGRVIFLHKITPGSADRSYGIHVARLAGLPHSVTVRADRLLRQLEKSSNGAVPGPQLGLFIDPDLIPRSGIEDSAIRILDEILALDLSNTTPLEALERLHRFQEEGRSSR
jgi:DNA mismatch repair protein MutS